MMMTDTNWRIADTYVYNTSYVYLNEMGKMKICVQYIHIPFDKHNYDNQHHHQHHLHRPLVVILILNFYVLVLIISAYYSWHTFKRIYENEYV